MFTKEGLIVGPYKFLDSEYIDTINRNNFIFHKQRDLTSVASLNIGQTLGGDYNPNYYKIWVFKLLDNKPVLVQLFTNYPNHTVPEYRTGYLWSNVIFPEFRGKDEASSAKILRFISWIRLGKPIFYAYALFKDSGEDDTDLGKACYESVSGKSLLHTRNFTHTYPNFNGSGKTIKIWRSYPENGIDEMNNLGMIDPTLYAELKAMV